VSEVLFLTVEFSKFNLQIASEVCASLIRKTCRREDGYRNNDMNPDDFQGVDDSKILAEM